MRVLVVLLAALTLSGAALAGGPRIVGIGEQKDGENIDNIHVGDTLVITLGANASTGYTWRLGSVNRRIAQLDSIGYVAAKHPPLALGARGIQVLTFKILAKGKTTLRLNYVSAAGKPSKKHFTLLLDVTIRT